MSEPHTSSTASTALWTAPRTLAVRASLRMVLVSVPLVLVPFACLEGTNSMCLDDYPWTFTNSGNNDVAVTPLTRARTGELLPLVVHGFQRGRFTVAAKSARTLRVETGDYAAHSVVVHQTDGRAQLLDIAPCRGVTRCDLDVEAGLLSLPASADELAASSARALIVPRLRAVCVALSVAVLPALLAGLWAFARGRRPHRR